MIVENLEKVGNSRRRKDILTRIPAMFERLNPERLCEKYANSLLDGGGRTLVIGFGKAAIGMYRGVRNALKGNITSAWIIIPEDEKYDEDFEELSVLRGTHPITGHLTEESSRKVLSGIGKLTERDIVIVLISGGGSALFEVPVPGVTIDDVAEISKCLMDSDANIYELNTFRKFYSTVKGGKLAELLRPAKVYGLIVSDVFGDDLSMIASGPLTHSYESEKDLDSITEKFGGSCQLLRDIRSKADTHSIQSGVFTNVKTELVLRNRDFVEELRTIISSTGFDCISLGSDINGDVTRVAETLAEVLEDLYSVKKNGFWFAFGGETTVTVSGSGHGGRNQELALRMLKKLRGRDFLFMSIGTDGIDGKSPAMGAIVDNELAERLNDDEISEYLSRSDSYTLLSGYDSAIITGRTGTNVSDVALGYYGDRMVKK